MGFALRLSNLFPKFARRGFAYEFRKYLDRHLVKRAIPNDRNAIAGFEVTDLGKVAFALVAHYETRPFLLAIMGLAIARAIGFFLADIRAVLRPPVPALPLEVIDTA
jgi:hypothetical protein